MSVSNRLDGMDWDFWKIASLCLGTLAVMGCFNFSYEDVMVPLGAVCSVFMPIVFTIIYTKNAQVSDIKLLCVVIPIALFSVFILAKINYWCIQWIVDIEKLKASENRASWTYWFIRKYDANSAATLFVGLQWCVFYLVKGLLLGEFEAHLKRVGRVGFMLLGTLVSALGLPWGFPILVALGELYFSNDHGSLKVRDGGGS